MENVVYIDRTRTIEYQRCPRRGWYTTYEGGRGIQSRKLSPHLLIGVFDHLGINELLNGHDIEYVIDALRKAWDAQIADRQVEECLSEYQEKMLADCWNLVEAHTRVFQLVVMPKLLEEYEIVDTEKEENYVLDGLILQGPQKLHDCDGPHCWGQPTLMWMGRTDAVLRHKVTEDIGVLSIKTTGKWDKKIEQRMKHDMQGLSEPWMVRQRGDIQPLFVQYLWLFKGAKKYNDANGQWEFNSPLTKGYKNDKEEWGHSYWWTCKEPHPFKKGLCEGGKKHTLSGWQAIDVATEFPGGIRGWIESLHARPSEIQGLSVETDRILDQQFVLPPEVYRSPQEIDRWRRSTVAERRRVIANARRVQEAKDSEEREQLLDELFPPYTHSCDDPGRCPFQEICFEGASPDDSTLYEPRRVNHPIEET